MKLSSDCLTDLQEQESDGLTWPGRPAKTKLEALAVEQMDPDVQEEYWQSMTKDYQSEMGRDRAQLLREQKQKNTR